MSSSWTKTEVEQVALRKGGKLLAQIMEELLDAAQVGVNTKLIGDLAETKIRALGADPIFKGYGKSWGAPPFPAAICISRNEEVVHGIPKKEVVLQSGDLLKIDIGMRYQGMVTDMARTKGIGPLSEEKQELLEVVKHSLEAGISVLRPGAKMEDYAETVEMTAKKAGFTCVRDLVGHGVGHELHEEPQIANYTHSGLPNFTFEEGMVVALEPMINAGSYHVMLAPDAWTFVTKDGQPSAHWENTVLITSGGAEVLTQV